MTATLNDVTKKIKPEPTAEELAARELVRRAREQGLSLTGPDGLLKQLTKTVLETALNEEMTGHLGYEKHDPAGQGAGSGNVRNGSRPKTVLTDGTGHVELDVPAGRGCSPEWAGRLRDIPGRPRYGIESGLAELAVGNCGGHFFVCSVVDITR